MKLSSGWGLKFVSRRALEQVSALWSKGSVFKFVILSLPLSVKVEGLPKSFIYTQ